MLLAAILLIAQTAPAPAATPAPCAAMDQNLPKPLAMWTMPETLIAGHDTLTIGMAATLDVAGPPKVAAGTEAHRFAHGEFTVEKAGVYGIAIDQAGWIDVSASGADKPLAAVEHGHGPDCSTIRKIVRFQLAPGTYRLSIKDPAKSAVKAMVIAY